MHLPVSSQLPLLALASLLLPGAAPGASEKQPAGADRPNIVWIVSEDNGFDHLRLYRPEGAPAPNIESLARDGIVFNHAFSNAPVCSVARSTLITGSYAPRLGLQYHRRSVTVPLPSDLRMFPAYLRDAGYYTTNNSKEDYNALKADDVWDESSNRASYSHRRPGQPFFHVQNFGTSHEGQLFFTREQMAAEPTKTDPASVHVPAYLPDTPLFRYLIARYLDLQMKMDAEVGEFVAQLKADGVYDDAIIFYYGDHGGVLPRSKGYLYESGLHVPLVVRVPARWQHLVTNAPGSRENAFVSFVDFGPTVLNLAGAAVPAAMDGRPFLGPGVTPARLAARTHTFGYADRFDEKYDLVRTLRQGKFKYMRSYQPFNPDALYNQYRYRQLGYQEWARLEQSGELTPVHQKFFEPRQPEALYDLSVDPDETENLAADPAYASVLNELRLSLTRWVKSLPDLSFYPETVLVQDAAADPAGFGQRHKSEIARLADIADLQLLAFAKAAPGIATALASDNRWERYWGLIVCSTFNESARDFAETASNLAAHDPEPLVRVRAAEFLGFIHAADPAPVLSAALAESTSAVESLLILNTVTLLRDFHGCHFDIAPKNLGRAFGEITNRLDHLQEP